MNVDLNINNYNYQELLNLFKVDNVHSKNNLERIQNRCQLVKENFSSEVHDFYMKAHKIISCVYNLFKYNLITNLEDSETISHYVNKIRKIESFEKYSASKIISQFLDVNLNQMEKNDNIMDVNEPDARLNDETYDLNTRPITNLNNKNNTNAIINTFPNSLSPGDLNSIKRITLFQNLNLNSCFRNNYYTSPSTDFQYLIPSEIKNVVSLRLASIEIPNAWYLFSNAQQNNYFKVVTNQNGTINEYTIIIPEGNYDNQSLQNYLNTVYFCNSSLENSLQNISVSINSYNFKTNFQVVNQDDATNFSFSLIFFEELNENLLNTNLMNTTGWILGFRSPSYLNVSNCVQSEGLFDGGGDRYIYLSLNDYQYNTNSTNIVGFDRSCMEENILAKILMINGKLSFIIDENNNPLTKTRKYNGPVNIRKLHIKILDKFGSIIDLNNMDFSFTLELEILYESFNFKDVFA